MFDLGRFREAQAGSPGFAEALAELRAGAKTGHWIWYVFPQLRGLGQSPMAVRYGLKGPEEAAAYLDDPLLADRLAAATAAVRVHLTSPDPMPLEELMGSEIDALKLVSCMTLFSHVARAEHARRPRASLAALADDAHAVLEEAAAQGLQRCSFTESQLAAANGRDPR
jgi:uncharacterized protein (DUF1810 family)